MYPYNDPIKKLYLLISISKYDQYMPKVRGTIKVFKLLK